MILTNKVMNFILHIYSNGGEVTKKDQYLHAFQYYTMCWHLRDSNVIDEAGLGKGGQKIWKLTEKGQKMAELLAKLKRVMNE